MDRMNTGKENCFIYQVQYSTAVANLGAQYEGKFHHNNRGNISIFSIKTVGQIYYGNCAGILSEW